MQEVPIPLPVGAVILGHYIVESLLGTGDFGTIYLVRDQYNKQELFALAEVINPNEQERYGFTLEYVSFTSLDHRALPHVQYVFNDDKLGRVYLLMSYIEEPNLEILRLQQPEKRFSLPQVMAIMAPVINAVAYLHHRRPPVIHRNIKPANIILSRTVDVAVLVMLDIVKERDSIMTPLHYFASGYGATEQYREEFSTRTDIYGLGATCYTLLTGIVPPAALYRFIQLSNGNIDPLKPVNEVIPAIPSSIAEVIQQAMSVDVRDCFSSVEQFWEVLRSRERRQLSLTISRTRPSASLPSPAVSKQAVEKPAPVSAPKQQRASGASELAVAKQAVEESAAVAAPRQAEEPGASEPAIAQAVEETETISVAKQAEEPRAPELIATQQAVEEATSVSVGESPEELCPAEPIVEQPVEEVAMVSTPKQPEELWAPEPIVEQAVEEAASVSVGESPEELCLPEPAVEQMVEEVATVSTPKQPEELYTPESVVTQQAVEEPETVSVVEPPEELYAPEPVVAEPAVEEAATVVAPMELEELHAPELVVAEPAMEEAATVLAPKQQPAPSTPEPIVTEPAVEEVVTVVMPMELEELHAPELVIAEPAVEEVVTVVMPMELEELHAPEPIVAEPAVEEVVTVSVVEPPEELHPPEPVVAQQAVEEAGSVSTPKPPQTPALKPAIPKRTVKKATSASIAKLRRAPRAWKLAVLLIVLVLLIGLGVSANFSSHVLTRSATPTAKPRLSSLTPTVRSSTPTPTSVSTILGGTYKGTIYDLPANVKTSLTLTNVRQSRGKISGYLTVGPGLFGYGPFSGTIDTTTKHFQFTVTDDAGNPTLFFEGEVQTPTSLSGDYYRCNPAQGNPCQRITVSGLSGDYYRCNPVQGNPCQRTTVGYGIWNVVLTS